MKAHLTIYVLISLAFITSVAAQFSNIRYGSKVPPEVDRIYERGLEYLRKTQEENGSWPGNYTSGTSGICLMAFLSSGEDPNYGKYAKPTKRAVQFILKNQNKKTGYMGRSMYEHGFALLALSEAYGAVDETMLWVGEGEKVDMATAIEKAINLAVTAQKSNNKGGWRYNPEAKDADTSITGAVLMGLLAAKNAGFEIPKETLERTLKYFKDSTGDNGFVAYTGGLNHLGQSLPRSAIASLVYAVSKKQDWKELTSTTEHIAKQLEKESGGHYLQYTRYYMAQALFQNDYESWKKWNGLLIQKLNNEQREDGSFSSNYGKPYATGMSLLGLALNYRFLPIYER